MADGFSGDRHAPMRSPLATLERWVIARNVGRFPKWIEGYHLTLATIIWTAGLLVFGYLAQFNVHWLWGSSVMLAAQWFTDSFDGALGRLRDTGIPKWGFYMDHLLDFVFMWSAFIAYIFVVCDTSIYWVVALAFVYSALMANAFLLFAVTGDFKITYLGLGPTEIRIVLAIANTVVIFFGPRPLEVILPYVLGALGFALVFVAYRTQRQIWAIDMEDKERKR